MDLRIITNNSKEFSYAANKFSIMKANDTIFYDINGIFGRGSSGLSDLLEDLNSGEVETVTIICNLFNLSVTLPLSGWRYDCTLKENDFYRTEHLYLK